ncbi:hypothetical protein MRBLMS1_002837 [Massilia sp. LMS1-1-1.1]
MVDWLCWLDNHSGLASWFGSVATLIAVVVALAAIYVQWRLTFRADAKRRDADEASTLLSLKYLANEIHRIMLLSGYQVDSVGNPTIYPDISAEFSAMSAMLDQLPMDRIASRRCVSQLLHLRRIAKEMSALFHPAPAPGDGFYLRNRVRISKLTDDCSRTTEQIGSALLEFAPALYRQHRAALERL